MEVWHKWTPAPEYSQTWGTPHERLELQAVAKRAGNIYIYLSNENPSPVDVFFDDLAITHTHHPVFQADEYYPFGMVLSHLERQPGQLGATDLNKGNMYLYNGKELQEDHRLDWYDYGARMYDGAVGRWRVVDPLAETMKRWSPYNYAFGNPLRYIDPDGFGPEDRVRKAKNLINKDYDQEPEDNRKLRTGNSKEALQYMDCSEFVCRVLDYDNLTDGVKNLNTTGLLEFLSNSTVFLKSNLPRVGDIALWKGHTGIVTAVNEEGKFKLTHARGIKKKSTENPYYAEIQDYRSSEFFGFYRPKVEEDFNLKTDQTKPSYIQSSTRYNEITYGPYLLDEVTIVGKKYYINEPIKPLGLNR